MILSVGYGPDAGGAFTLNLGPLSQRGGERRLNVAITRAREQLIVFSSFAPEDCSAGDAAGQGVQISRRCSRSRARRGRAARRAMRGPWRAAMRGPRWRCRRRARSPPRSRARSPSAAGPCATRSAAARTRSISRSSIRATRSRYVLAIEHDGAAYASAAGCARSRSAARAGARPARLAHAPDLVARLVGDPEREIQRAHGAIVTAVAASRQRRAVARDRRRRGAADRPAPIPRAAIAQPGGRRRRPVARSDHEPRWPAPAAVAAGCRPARDAGRPRGRAG